jgi:RNA-directed DNA polymerase
VLANLFMHYAFDTWLEREFPTVEFERYADLCRARHKSAYAEHRIMPTRLPDALVRGGLAVFWSA